MITYRVPPYPLVAQIKDIDDSGNFQGIFYDENGIELSTQEVTVPNDGTLTVEIPSSKYDTEFSFEVVKDGNVIREEPIFLVRPYIHPRKLVDEGAAQTLEQAQSAEGIARAIIDSVTGGFYYKKEIFEIVGSGSKYIELPYRINNILNVIEDGVTVFSSEVEDNSMEFTISKDKSAISIINAGSANRVIFDTSKRFSEGIEYIIEIESGWKIVPLPIVRATRLLVQDIINGQDYLSRYITNYSTDQYTVSFSTEIFSGTGNKQVDALLRPYRDSHVRAGII